MIKRIIVVSSKGVETFDTVIELANQYKDSISKKYSLLPIIDNLIGPINDHQSSIIRYESEEVYELLSN